ncbi:MAG: twin-arginine translocation signal domain-containing protein, partial [Chloroflexi bacterium]|nr:twin-arginine translocation signal domain-containing protein [Chloroflexota bacterium]
MSAEMGRRQFLKRMAMLGGGLLLAACAPKAEPTAAPAEQKKAEAAPTAPPKAAPKEVELRYMAWWGAYNQTALPQTLEEIKEKLPKEYILAGPIAGA